MNFTSVGETFTFSVDLRVLVASVRRTASVSTAGREEMNGRSKKRLGEREREGSEREEWEKGGGRVR